MFRLIIVIVLVVNLNYILTDQTSTPDVDCNDDSGQCEESVEPVDETTTPERTSPTQEESNELPSAGSGHNAQENFDKGIEKTTAKFFYNVVKENPGKSVIMSTYSSLFLLAALALRAKGETAEQILNALNFKDKNEISIVIPKMLDSIEEQKNVTLSLVARVYGNINSKFSKTFKTETKKILRAESENIDFSNGQKAADIINKWVADNTNQKIKDLIPAFLLTPNTELVLTNAFYFLGEWRNKFNPASTSLNTFHVSEKETVKVKTMNQVKYFNYAEINNINAQVLELPYVNENITCLVILPRAKNGATSLLSKLLDENSLSSIRSRLRSTRVAVSLPKFNTTTTIDLKKIFKKCNITALFDPKKCRLENILANGRNLVVSEGIQKANIEVNESGSEAAAGNAIVGVATASMPVPPKVFNANRPFTYYLLFRGSPIFCGLFAGN